MKYESNILDIAKLEPDYMGFIFYDRSSRYVDNHTTLPELNNNITEKVGVFVNSSIEEILGKIDQYNLNAIQLHGDESPEFCKELRSKSDCTIIKAFQVDDSFDFESTQPYLDVADYLLFDTKSDNYGGSGSKFNWQLLLQFNYNKPIILSGGISLNEIPQIVDNKILKELNIHAIDINSKFEIEPGLKHVDDIATFIKNIRDAISS